MKSHGGGVSESNDLDSLAVEIERVPLTLSPRDALGCSAMAGNEVGARNDRGDEFGGLHFLASQSAAKY